MKTVHVHDLMQRDYAYTLAAPMGKQFAEGFKPVFTPAEMLEHGVFEGKYLNDCTDEFPVSWFKKAKLSDVADPSINCFGIKSRQPLLSGPADSEGGRAKDQTLAGIHPPRSADQGQLRTV